MLNKNKLWVAAICVMLMGLLSDDRAAQLMSLGFAWLAFAVQPTSGSAEDE